MASRVAASRSAEAGTSPVHAPALGAPARARATTPRGATRTQATSAAARRFTPPPLVWPDGARPAGGGGGGTPAGEPPNFPLTVSERLLWCLSVNESPLAMLEGS